MPGYTIVGVKSGMQGWENTDALHCRTRGVMDFEMLFVDHRDVVHGEQAWQDSIAVTSRFVAYSGKELKQDSLLVYYSIDGEVMNVTVFNASGQQVLFAEGGNNVGIETLPPGLYLVKENYRNGDSKVRKMVKK